MELVWENGQVLVRGLSGNPPCFSYPPSAMKFQENDDEETFSSKTRRLDRCSGREECSKLQNSMQEYHHAGLCAGLYQNDFNLFFENTRKFDGVDSQVVPVCKNASSRNGSKLNPQLTVPELQNRESDRQHLRMQSFFVPETLPLANNNMELPLDEQSQASGFKNNAFQLFPDKVLVPIQASSAAEKMKEKSGDQTVRTTSMGSRASNDMVNSRARRRQEDNDFTTSPSNNVEEEKSSSYTEVYQRGCCKKKRSTEVHNLSERKRRAKINKKMRELQELIPNSDKVDKASMLDQAIEYLKALQIQIQIMQMASSLCTQSMMSPSGMLQLQASQLGHLFPSLGTGIQMGSFGCNQAMYTAASSMFGISGQMIPMALPQTPCLPFMAGSSILPHSFHGLATPGEFLASAPLLCSKVLTHDSNSGNNGNVLSSKTQTSSRR